MKKILSTVLAGLIFLLPGSELPELLARFGNIELKKERFHLFNIPQSPPERRAALKKLVDTEICLIITRQLLERSAVMPDSSTAARYVEMRKKQFAGKMTEEFRKNFESRISKPEFQLKCALYFTFYKADPAAVEPTQTECRRHYELNKEQFRNPVKSDLALFKAGSKNDQGREKAKLILARLRQGEDFQALAKQYDPAGPSHSKKAASELGHFFRKIKDLSPGESDSVETPKGIFIVKLLSRAPQTYRSFEEMSPYVTEMLSSLKLKNSLEQYIREILTKERVQYFF